jgi:uncharacterized protein YprB with RNaseH-like and TPR domain
MPDFGKALRRLRTPVPVVDAALRPRLSLRQQLEFLKARYTRRTGAGGRPLEVVPVLPAGNSEVTPFGTHYVVRTEYPHDHFHGKVRLDRFSCGDLRTLLSLMRQACRISQRESIIFLDTETTGMQGGTGMCPFLIGVGFFVEDEFHVVQYFIRDFDEEPSMLYALGELLRRFELVVTYNGAAFDIPLLETRLTLARFENPFERLEHFDLLPAARRLWRAGHGSCRLTALEKGIVAFDRGPDVPGAMIPRVYFDFVNRGAGAALESVFAHNTNDVVSLAALAVCASDRVTSEPAMLDAALDLYSLARILQDSRDWRRSIRLYEMAVRNGLPELIRIKALENLVVISRRTGDYEKSFKISMELMREDTFSATGYEGAAIYYERIQRNPDAARDVLMEALQRLPADGGSGSCRKLIENRWQRLRQKVIRF